MKLHRRAFLSFFSQAGLAGTLLPGVLWSQLAHASEERITPDMVESAAQVAGLDFTAEERKWIARGVERLIGQYESVRGVSIPNDLAPPLVFDPHPKGFAVPEGAVRVSVQPESSDLGSDEQDIAFAGIRSLAGALRERTITSAQLTQLSLDRLKRFDPELECVVTLTQSRALEQAQAADAALQRGDAASLLHGIPWGAKDLLAVAGYPTTWGAKPFKDQHFDYDAAVVERLDAAGAVLVAKLTLGALAMGDIWYGGRTNSPWNSKRGSSGSSAGPAAATAAGLVSFSIGSETNGSIISPSTVCGLTGLRPTFGRVSRHGAMALSWSLDKLGPMCRSAEDCAIVFAAITGRDARDAATRDAAFTWPVEDPTGLRVGFAEHAFDETGSDADRAALSTFENLGVAMTPVALSEFPYNDLMHVLSAEAAAAFDDLTRSNRDDELVNQAGIAWPNRLRTARFIPAVEYLQANRVRSLLIDEMGRLFADRDAVIVPGYHGLFLGNLTGIPSITFPIGFTNKDEPITTTILGRLYGEAGILSLAHAFQQVTDFHRRRPPIS